ncbi:conserved oligomeric Golgi complex subunit 4 [Vanessa cardui]|uniref:conserved oligomeric Golgi complex subunit 4 n=1 Tax=Vanessa cardui TaxID=171605 RepID=UPI001F13A810|nr:conserved oligomeric Golgi complex subunit 4 [Vanessa cardui]
MSLTLLLEKYDVSTEEGLQKALNEIEKEEAEVDEALSNALSRSCTLEGRLRTASQAYTKLGEVKNDAQVAADMVDKTAALARDVSAKVRQLDLARSRVAECQRRVHDLIDLTVCSAGVETAIKAHDYETAAGHVARFLSMEPGSVAAARARGAPDPRRDMDAAARTLRDHLVRKFEEAAKRDDDAAVERLFKLFPQIGRAEEGVDLLAKYLATQLEASVRRAGAVERGGAGEFAAALTRALEAGAAAVERARAALAEHAAPRAPALLPAALRLLQPKVCSGARRVCSELLASSRASGEQYGDPRAAEPALTELALAHSRLQLYFGFLRRRPELMPTTNEADKEACSAAIEKIISECDVTRVAQDVLSHYLTLERYFLEESVNKALKMSAAQAGATTSSLVDDVFFIARKVIRRGISTGSADGACAVLNEAGAQLERCGVALRRRLAAPPPDPLPLPPPPRRRRDAARHPPRDDAPRALYLALTDDAENGAEWAERLAEEACAEAEALWRSGGDVHSGRAKLRSCAAGLGAAAGTFRAARDLALAALRAALLPVLSDWADALVDPDTDIEDLEEEAGALPAALDVLAEAARAQLPRSADTLLTSVLGELLTRAEDAMLRNYYDRRGALCAERRCRRLAVWAGGALAGSRERAGQLAGAAAVLAVERAAHAPDALPAAALPPARLRDLLARRTDFKLEDIKRLKL